MTRISIEVSPEEHKNIKVLASLEGKKIKDFVLDKIFGDTDRELKPETILAIQDALNNKNITKHDSVDDMFKSLSE